MNRFRVIWNRVSSALFRFIPSLYLFAVIGLGTACAQGDPFSTGAARVATAIISSVISLGGPLVIMYTIQSMTGGSRWFIALFEGAAFIYIMMNAATIASWFQMGGTAISTIG